MTTDQFRCIDIARWPQAVRFEFEREESHDDNATPLDWMDETEDVERIAAWRNDEFTMIGIRAKVTVYVPIGGGSFSVFEMTSPGLWGIESDSGEDYLTEVFEDERAGLLDAMRQMGFAALVCEVLS